MSFTAEDIVQQLREPFAQEDIKQRPDGYDYIDQENITSRLLDATGGVFDVDVQRGPELVNDGKKSFWLTVVKLTIPGLGSRTSVGTAQALNEDAPKSATTDALKKAATLFGCGLQLYEKPAQTQNRRAASTNAAQQTRRQTDSGTYAGRQEAPARPATTQVSQAEGNGEMSESQETAIRNLSKKAGQAVPDMTGWSAIRAGQHIRSLQTAAAAHH